MVCGVVGRGRHSRQAGRQGVCAGRKVGGGGRCVRAGKPQTSTELIHDPQSQSLSVRPNLSCLSLSNCPKSAKRQRGRGEAKPGVSGGESRHVLCMYVNPRCVV